MQKLLNSWIPKVLAVAIIFTAVGLQSHMVLAASATSLSDNQSRLRENVDSNHDIKFVTPSGVQAAETITLTFSADYTSVNTISFEDVDFAEGNTNNCTTATFTDETLAAAASGTTWGAASSGQVVTLTSATGTIATDVCVRIRIGTNAVVGTTGTDQITNGGLDDNDDSVVIGGTFGDTGTIAMDIIADDQVVVTATVDPSITFAISDNTIGFGSLSAADDRFANGAGTGSSITVVAHTLAAGTNATSGYVMYILGGTLTSGLNTITAPAGPGASTTGSEQFGLNLVATGGTGTPDAQYGTASQYGFGSTSATQDNIASATGPTATTTYDASYVGNIAAVTEAGSYSTTLTYTATATY